MARVHPTSIVEPGVELADDVAVGPFCHLRSGARIGRGTRIEGHAVIHACTMGAENVIHAFATIGGEAQVRAGAAEPGRGLTIGDSNVFRENVTVNASSGGGTTQIGSRNLFMAGSHVAHDVRVGSDVVIANGVQLAGHVTIGDWVTFGGLAGVAQHLIVGESAFVAAGAMCERDVPPFVIAQGDRARVRAPNVVGLARRGVPSRSIAALRRAVASLWRGGTYREALARLDRADPWVARLAAWLEDPARQRGRPRRVARDPRDG